MSSLRLSVSKRRGSRALTQVEMLVSMAVITILGGAMVVGALLLQRSFQASSQYVAKEAAQMRLLDFLALDLRRALTVNTSSGGIIQLTIPNFYQTDGAPRNPHIQSGMAYYGNPTQPVAVSYYKSNGCLYREQGSQVTNVAADVEDFQVSFRDEGQVIEVSVSFVPTFQRSGGSREGTRTVTRTLLRNKRRT